MNPKTHLRLFCVLLAACLLLPLAAACRQGGEGTGTQTGTHTDTGFSVSRLRVDSQTLPLGLDNAAPLFSWNMTVGQEDTVRGRVQTAYRVLGASDRGLLESGTADMWDSGTVQDERRRAPAISAKRAGYGRQAAPQTDESRGAHSFSAAHSGWRKGRPLRTRSCCLPPMTAEPCI